MSKAVVRSALYCKYSFRLRNQTIPIFAALLVVVMPVLSHCFMSGLVR